MRAPSDAIAAPTDEEFSLLRRYVQREAGIQLGPAKRALLVARLMPRLRRRGCTSFGAYYRLLHELGDEERVPMLDAICTNETHFFREPDHFDYLETVVLPAWEREASAGERPRRIHAWSAGCSTGEEPYSLAMSLLARFPPESGWEIRVLGTDLSVRVLSVAQAGVWPIERASTIPRRHLHAFMLRGVREEQGKMAAGRLLREVVRFERANLSSPELPAFGPFDLVFCRNVLIYFGLAEKKAALGRLVGRLDPAGLLFVGHAESLTNLVAGVRCVRPTVYLRDGAPARGRARPDYPSPASP